MSYEIYYFNQVSLLACEKIKLVCIHFICWLTLTETSLVKYVKMFFIDTFCCLYLMILLRFWRSGFWIASHPPYIPFVELGYEIVCRMRVRFVHTFFVFETWLPCQGPNFCWTPVVPAFHLSVSVKSWYGRCYLVVLENVKISLFWS